jgi:tetratricopeptide (TPR) repeat protein
MFRKRSPVRSSEAASGRPSEQHLDLEQRQAAAQARGTELFDIAQVHFRARKFEKAAEAFAAAEAEIKGVPALRIWEWRFQIRRAASLRQLKRMDEALAILDKLVADQKKLKAANLHPFPRDKWPDELPTMYWSRLSCLYELGRLAEARDAIPDLIEEMGSGSTPTQRHYLGSAYFLQASVAQSEGDYDQALRAIDAVLAHCGRHDEEWAEPLRRIAAKRRKSVVAMAEQRASKSESAK